MVATSSNIDLQRGDHVEQGVSVDVLLMRMAAEDELELRRGDEFAHHMLDVVADDAFRGGEVADAHPDNPALGIGHELLIAPLFDILAHRDVLRLPMVRLHRPIKIVGPLIFQWQEIEGHGHATIDDLLAGECGLSLCLVEDKSLGTYLKRFLHETLRDEGVDRA
jgi:hypothetical protein